MTYFVSQEDLEKLRRVVVIVATQSGEPSNHSISLSDQCTNGVLVVVAVPFQKVSQQRVRIHQMCGINSLGSNFMGMRETIHTYLNQSLLPKRNY